LRSGQEGDAVKEPEYEEFYVHEILCGKKGTDFKGIFPLFLEFMKMRKYTKEQQDNIGNYMSFLHARASG